MVLVQDHLRAHPPPSRTGNRWLRRRPNRFDKHDEDDCHCVGWLVGFQLQRKENDFKKKKELLDALREHVRARSNASLLIY